MKTIKFAIVPHLGSLLIMDGKSSYFVASASIEKKSKDMMLSAHQLAHELKNGEPTFVASLLEIPDDLVYDIPPDVWDILEEFSDVMPPELPCELSPRRAINHQIELVPGCKPPAQAPYQMAPLELTELRHQLTDLLDSGFI